MERTGRKRRTSLTVNAGPSLTKMYIPSADSIWLDNEKADTIDLF
jgi:hypothetical protein